jgi:deferrochelatase/peroxidase EfeB
MTSQVSRRGFLGGLVGGAALGAAGTAIAVPRLTEDGVDPGQAVPFEGAHQAGIVTPAQDRLCFAVYDVTTKDRSGLRDLLIAWTAAARALTRGQTIGDAGATGGDEYAPPQDTGEALDLPAAGLTVTIGFGGSLFDRRFGLASRRPDALVDLPAFPLDELDPARAGGDLCLQVCANDEQVAFHAVRQFSRIGAGVVNPRYVQQGSARTSGVQQPGVTPRNLMGFKDGTNNIALDTGDLIWAAEPDWMAGGSYLVTRRIRMIIETWDRTSLREQQEVIGRRKGDGAPLTGTAEHDVPDFHATTAGRPVIPADAHVRLAHPDQNRGARMLRRGYNFMDGTDRTGRTDAGLFFMAYQADPRRAFIPVQRSLSTGDALNEYIKHVGSGVWACPPGVGRDGYWGQGLLGSG